MAFAERIREQGVRLVGEIQPAFDLGLAKVRFEFYRTAKLLARLLFVAHKIPPVERDRTREDLLKYCERDTWAMVMLLERLRELVGR